MMFNHTNMISVWTQIHFTTHYFGRNHFFVCVLLSGKCLVQACVQVCFVPPLTDCWTSRAKWGASSLASLSWTLVLLIDIKTNTCSWTRSCQLFTVPSPCFLCLAVCVCFVNQGQQMDDSSFAWLLHSYQIILTCWWLKVSFLALVRRFLYNFHVWSHLHKRQQFPQKLRK